VALGQEADSALSELRFGDIARVYGPEASLGLFMEEFSDAPDDPFVDSRAAKVFLSRYLNELGDVPSFR
jgi:hypothetical protein